LHLVNLTSAATWRAPIDELIPVGPFGVKLRLPEDVPGNRVKFLVSGRAARPQVKNGWASVDVTSILDQEVLVFD
jgi:hypothetical protein